MHIAGGRNYYLNPFGDPTDVRMQWSKHKINQQYGEENTLFFQDTSQIWSIGEYSDMWIINGENAFNAGKILKHNKNTIYFDSSATFANNDRYYIVWNTPSIRAGNAVVGAGIPNSPWPWAKIWGDSSFVNEIRFEQKIFHRNRLYGLGFEIVNGTVVPSNRTTVATGDTINTSRIWMAELGIPNTIQPNVNFDITGANLSPNNVSVYSNDDAQQFFVLRDDLYVITKSNIYRISGEPDFTLPGFGIILSQVIAGVGSNQPKGVVTTRDNKAYIMNQESIWKFDGNNIGKIGFKVDSLVERYRESRMVAGKFKDELYFSYPDSDITIVLHTPTNSFSTWSFGMETINDQFVKIDSNYFLFSRSEDSASVLRYPNAENPFLDENQNLQGSIESNVYEIKYLTGWFDPDPNLMGRKTINSIKYVGNNGTGVNNLVFSIQMDFADSTIRADTISKAGPFIRRSHLAAGTGYYFRIKMTGSPSEDFVLSNIALDWSPSKYGGVR